MSECKFKEGQRWLTRSGKIAIILDCNAPSSFPILGRVDGKKGYDTWDKEGFYVSPSKQDPLDLISRVEEGSQMETPKFKVGQRWRDRAGDIVTIASVDDRTFEGYPIKSVDFKGSYVCCDLEGRQQHGKAGRYDLVELVDDGTPVLSATPLLGYPPIPAGLVDAAQPKTEARKDDQAKPDLSLLPGVFKDAVAWTMMDGERKYGRWNYTKASATTGKGMDIVRLIAAAERHLDALKRGEWMVPDSVSGKATHAGAVAANMLMITHLHALDRLADSRLIETEGGDANV